MPHEVEPIPENMLSMVPAVCRPVLQVIRQGGLLGVYTGVVDTENFNDPRVSTLLEHLKEARGARIVIITPPLVIEDSNGDNGLFDLSRRKVVEWYVRDSVGDTRPHLVAETTQGDRVVILPPDPLFQIHNRS